MQPAADFGEGVKKGEKFAWLFWNMKKGTVASCQPIFGYRNLPAMATAAAGSRHLLGQAADIAVRGVVPAEVAKYAESLGVLGIGLYGTPADGYFVHIDTRKQKSFWYGQAQTYRESFGGYGQAQFRAALAAVLDVEEEKILLAAPTLGEKWNRRHPAVKSVQQYLAALGYSEVGSADGVAGPQFAAAVAHFQKDQGCEATGILEQWGISWHKLLQSGEGGKP